MLKETAIHPIYNIDMGNGNILETFSLQKLNEKYSYLYINIETIVRNYIDSIDLDNDNKLQLFKDTNKLLVLNSALVNVLSTFIHNTTDIIQVYFYRCTYKRLYKEVSNIRKLEDYTGWKYWLHKKLSKIIEAISKEAGITVNVYDYRIPVQNDSIIITHMATDLLNFMKSSNTVLLESYTGRIKDKKEWNSKYHSIGKRDLTFLPFNEFLLRILGDKYLIKPMDIRIRRKVYEIAISKKWSIRSSLLTTKRDVGSIVYGKDTIIDLKDNIKLFY